MKWSINDLVLIQPNSSKKAAIDNSIELAILAEELAYHRLWYAEHHFNDILISCSPECIIPLVAAKTSKIRIGSGGILLNYYSAFKIAETFILLSEIFPDRIDLGIGRSSSGPLIDVALSDRSSEKIPDDYNSKVEELLCWMNGTFEKGHKFENIIFPHRTSRPEIFLLGSSISSAILAGKSGISLVLGEFFPSKNNLDVINKYYEKYKPATKQVRCKPYVVLCFRIIIGESENAIRRLIAPLELMKRELLSGSFKEILAPDEAISKLGYLPAFQSEFLISIGSPIIYIGTALQVVEIIKNKTKALIVDEIILQDFMFDHNMRLCGYIELMRTVKNLCT